MKDPVGPAALATVRERDLLDRVRFTSFEWAYLRAITGEDVRIGGPLGEADAASVDAAAERGYEYVGIRHEDLTPALVERAHDGGLVVGAWTVNDAGAIRRAIEHGVDAITTDRPDIALDVARQYD